MRWGMVVDLRRCVGCQTCTIACMQANALPAGVQWRTVADCEVGTYPDVRRVFLPLACMHCADPPCVPVCPTGASRQRADGIVWVDHESCLGCGYCAVACPYRARHLVHAVEGRFGAPTPSERATARPERRGVMSKCTFCMERVDAGRAAWLVPGADAAATPMCAAACIAGAITFGDLDDPASAVARLVAAGRAVPLMPECGTRPSVYYVGRDAAPAAGPLAASSAPPAAWPHHQPPASERGAASADEPWTASPRQQPATAGGERFAAPPGEVGTAPPGQRPATAAGERLPAPPGEPRTGPSRPRPAGPAAQRPGPGTGRLAVLPGGRQAPSLNERVAALWPGWPAASPGAGAIHSAADAPALPGAALATPGPGHGDERPAAHPLAGTARGSRPAASLTQPATLVPAARQRLWGLPAVANFALGGLGAGLYLAAAAAGAPGALAMASWFGPALVLAGFAAVATEAGRPLRGPLALRRVRTSWMSRELALGLLFAAAAGADLLAPAPALRALAALAAAGLALAQGFVLRRARGVAAWDTPAMPVVFLASALIGGTGLLLMLHAAAGHASGGAVLGGAMALVALGLVAWLAYVTWSTDEAFVRPTRVFREDGRGMALLAGGYVLPFALLAAAIAVETPGAAAVAGALMVAGQVGAKWWLIVEAGELRPITLDTLELRRRPS